MTNENTEDKTNNAASGQNEPVVISERIVCAANRHPFAATMLLGARHFDKPMLEQLSLLKSNTNLGAGGWEQGFINQKGEFLSRTAAWKAAEAAGQIIRRVGGDTANGGTLYSENLY